MFEGTLTLVAYVKIFVAMLVVVNPFGIMPVFAAMTRLQSAVERKRIARIAAQTVAVALLISAIFGERILDMFGISIASMPARKKWFGIYLACVRPPLVWRW